MRAGTPRGEPDRPTEAPYHHAQRVRSRIATWRRIGASRQVLSWLEQGVQVQWNELGPPPPFHHGCATFTAAERAWLTVERDRCLRTGAWQRAQVTTHVSRAFVVYHKGKPRLVIDLRALNMHTRTRTCRFESLASLRRMIRRGDWMFTLDITDAYHHVPMHCDALRFFTFAIQSLDAAHRPQTEYFSTPALNFGWTNSPAIFTEIISTVVQHIRCPRPASSPPAYGCTRRAARQSGTRTLPWLDDLAFFVRSHYTYEQACARRDEIHQLMADLGLLVAPEKGEFDPTHFLTDHLGYGIDSERGLFLLTQRRERALAAGSHMLLQRRAAHQGRVRTRALAAFCGLAESSGLALPLGRYMLRALYDDLAQRRGWGGTVLLSTQSRSDLRWWAALRGSPHVGRAIWRPPETREAWSDASGLGWGGAVPRRFRMAPAYGFWDPEELQWHITRKELAAVRLTILAFLDIFAGHRVLWHEDNQCVVWILTNFVSKSRELMLELRRLWFLLATHDISLHPVYIRSAENRIADAASRMACSGDYALARQHFEEVQQRWGWCTIDAFASAATAQLPRFWTRVGGCGGEAIDALAQSWIGERLWIHPPPALLPAVVQMLEETGAEAYVCAPRWPRAAWDGLLHEISIMHIELPPGSLRRVAADAPARLLSWSLVVFRVPRTVTAWSSARFRAPPSSGSQTA